MTRSLAGAFCRCPMKEPRRGGTIGAPSIPWEDGDGRGKTPSLSGGNPLAGAEQPRQHEHRIHELGASASVGALLDCTFGHDQTTLPATMDC